MIHSILMHNKHSTWKENRLETYDIAGFCAKQKYIQFHRENSSAHFLYMEPVKIFL